MTSHPDPSGYPVSIELAAFFQVELRNAANIDDAPVQTLGTAHESLCQAPPEIIAAWFTPHGDAVESWPTHPLIEFGGLLNQFGDDAELVDFMDDDEPEPPTFEGALWNRTAPSPPDTMTGMAGR